MKVFNLSKSDVPRLVSFLQQSHAVLAPQAKGQHFVFAQIADPASVVLDYPTTILPPKKYFQPPWERLMRFDMRTQEAEPCAPQEDSRVLLGVHPCDMMGILRLDWAFSRDRPEANWIARRKATLIFGVTQVPDEYVFSKSVKANDPEKGYDGFFFTHAGAYTLAVYTAAGERALAGLDRLRPASPADLEAGKRQFEIQAARQKAKLECSVSELPLLLKGTFDHPYWKEIADRCLSCASCTMVCPTCFCFDVDDEVDLTLTKGARVRRWDSCQLRDFTVTAGGHAFREKRENRAKHRIYRKFKYLSKDHEWLSFCVGCGRCSRACTARINIVDIVNTIYASS